MSSQKLSVEGAPNSRRVKSWHRHSLALSVAGVLAIGGGVAIAAASSPSASNPPLRATTVAPYKNIVANATLHTYYILSNESGGTLHCTAGCLSVWKPFIVAKAVTTIKKSTAVKDLVGFVKRSSTTKQVTLNGFPIYTYIGDSGASQVNGEGVTSNGGTWYVVNATTTSAGSTGVTPKALLILTNASPYTGVLANSSSRSLYVLSVESAGVLSCTAGCLSAWFPVLVPNSVTSIIRGAGVNGTVGFVARANSMSQVTFNGFPVYTYVGDSGPLQANGEGVSADGGTWYLVNASSTTTGTTEIPVISVATTTTTYHYGY